MFYYSLGVPPLSINAPNAVEAFNAANTVDALIAVDAANAANAVDAANAANAAFMLATVLQSYCPAQAVRRSSSSFSEPSDVPTYIFEQFKLARPVGGLTLK